MAPNWQIEFGVGGVTVDCRNPAATTTHYTDPRTLAAYAQTVIRASAQTGASAYTVVFDDERVSPTNPTYKWTIASNGANFDLLASDDPDSILPSLGFTGTSYTGAATYTGENVAIHTEEYLVMDRVGTIRYHDSTEITQDFRWLVLVDLNFSGVLPSSPPATAGLAKITIYTSTAAITLDATPDSTFTEGTNMFTLGHDANLGSKWGTDFEMSMARLPGTLTPSSLKAGPARMWVIDLRLWKGSAFDANNDMIRIKIVDRTNPAGYVSLGYCFLGPGFAWSRNPRYPYQSGIQERSELMQSAGGSFNSAFEEPGARDAGTWDNNSPMSEVDHWWVKSVFLGNRKTDTTAPHQSVRDLNVVSGVSRPTIFIDPTYAPSVLTTGGTFPNATLYARGAMFGYMKMRQGNWQFTNIRHGDFEFIEEPIS